MNARIADRDDFVPMDISTHIDTLPEDYVSDKCLPRVRKIEGIIQMVLLFSIFANEQAFVFE